MSWVRGRCGGLTPAGGRTRSVVRAAALLALLAGGCDYPTSSPKWYTEWLVPIKDTRLSGAELLPASVSTVADGSAFLVAVSPTTMTRTLGQLCGQVCVQGSGSSMPKPAFAASLVDTLDLPGGVSAATLVGGTVSVSVTNGFSFDPLRPSATARGSLTIALTSGTTTLGTLTLSGSDTALPPGTTLRRDLALGNGPVSGGVLVTLTLTSPAGDPAWIDASQGLSVTATAGSVRVTSVAVVVNEKPVAVQPMPLDLSDVDQSLIDRVHGGTLVVKVDNPFPITGPMTLTINGGGLSAPVRKTVAVLTGQSTQRVDFALPELQSILGRAGLEVRGDGVVSAATPVAVTPWQSVLITTQLDLIVGPKEN